MASKTYRSFYLNEYLDEKLVEHAASKSISVSKLIREAVENYLKESSQVVIGGKRAREKCLEKKRCKLKDYI